MGYKTKIDWCDASWNPVTGCYHDCPYCYARSIARRFGMHLTEWKYRNIHDLDKPVRKKAMPGKIGPIVPYLHDFEPTIHRYKLDEPQKWKKPCTIFVCSMADLFGDWVPDEWIAQVFDACAKAPWHRYLFLTKNPARYRDICLIDALPYGDRFWYGSTVTGPTEGAFIVEQEKKFYHTFVSIEPIQERFGPYALNRNCIELTDWVIIGAETGNRKGKIIPERAWIEEIVAACEKYDKPVFMKESLRGIMGDDFRQEYPWEV